MASFILRAISENHFIQKKKRFHYENKIYTDRNTFEHSCSRATKICVNVNTGTFSQRSLTGHPELFLCFQKWQFGDLSGSILPSWIKEPTQTVAQPADSPSSQGHTYHTFCNSAASKTTMNSFLIILIRILHKVNVCEKHFEMCLV